MTLRTPTASPLGGPIQTLEEPSPSSPPCGMGPSDLDAGLGAEPSAGKEEAPPPPIEAPTFGDRPKDPYWAASAEVLWRQVRGALLPRMRAGERTIQAFMRDPQTTETAMLSFGNVPQTQALDPVLFEYEEIQPEDGSARYWAVEARTDYLPYLMETGPVAREHSSPRQVSQPIRDTK